MHTVTSARKPGLFGLVDHKLFWPPLLVFIAILIFALVAPATCGAFFASIQQFVLTNFSWLILAVGAAAILFSLWMLLNRPFGNIRLGGQDCKPEFSFYAWVSMLFCAGLGTGFVIFGAAEPLYHLYSAPTIIDAGTAGTARPCPRPSALPWSTGDFSAGRCSARRAGP